MNDRIEKCVEINAPVSRVWKALTDHREFSTWFRVRLDGPFVPGQPSRGNITYPGYEHLRWEATIQKMEPERYFSFTWRPYAADPTRDYSGEEPTLRRVHAREDRQGHAAARGRKRVRQDSARPSRRGLPNEHRRLGRADEKHLAPCPTSGIASFR